MTDSSKTLTIEDYKNHRSFIRCIEQPMFYVLTMKSDVTIDGVFMALDNRVVPGEQYEVAF